MNRTILALALAFSGSTFAVPPPATANGPAALLNVSKATLLDCSETISKVSKFIDYATGTAPILGYSKAVVIDYGDSFVAMNLDAGATAFSSHLEKDWRSSFKVAYPTNGVMMGRGYGESAGTFVYVGPAEMISWDCRR